MAQIVIMPKTNMDMEEGTIIAWLTAEGETVSKGDSIAEIETGKASMDLEAEADGVLLKHVAAEGETVLVTKAIAWIGEKGEEIPEIPQEDTNPSQPVVEISATTSSNPDQSPTEVSTQVAAQMSGDIVKATPAARMMAKEKGIPLAEVSPTGKSGEVIKNDVINYSHNNKITPLARKMAQDAGISESSIGTDGRIYSGDITRNTAQSVQGGSCCGGREDRIEPLTTMQKITGKRLKQSHTDIPVVTSSTRVDVTRLLAMRKELNSSSDKKYTINDFVLKATALALADNPRLNSTLAPEGDKIIYKGAINIGMAVATPKGLLVPVIHNTDLLNMAELSETAASLAQSGREGSLGMDALTGGTFTISNIGMFGVTEFTPIINQPEAAILGVCAIEEQLKLVDGEIEQHQIMGLSLTFDHRIVDGAESSMFIKSLKDYLENPLGILVK